MRELISSWIDYILWGVLIVLPTAISFVDIHNLFSPFKFPILISLSTLVLILVIINRKVKWDFLSYCAVLWLSLVFLASLNAYNQELAFLGFNEGYGRYEGFISLACYVILWFAAKNFLIVTYKRILIWFIGMIPFAVYALVQYYGYDPLVLNYGFTPRIFSTIGNQNFVGSLAVILVVFSSVLFISSKNWLFFIFSLLFFSTLVVCQTRSAWVACSLVMVLFMLDQVIRKRNFYFPSFLIIGFVLVGLFLVTSQHDNSVIQKSKTISKELNLSNEYGGSGRLKIWSITEKVIWANPWAGVGPENLKIAIKKEQPELYKEYYKRTKTTIDKAHNEYLHMAVTCGIPALIIYLVMLGTSLVSFIRSCCKSAIRLAFFLTVIAYLIQAFFNISVIAVAPVFWILLGGLAGDLSISQKLVNENNQENQVEVIE